MKIAVLGDMHGDLKLTDEMKRAINEADLLFLNGDLTNFGAPSDLHSLLDELKRHTSTEIKAVPGNCDTREVFLELQRAGINMHRSAETREGLGIIAVGGSNITPFGTPIEFSEEDISEFLTDSFSRVKDCESVILFSHFPPKDTAVDMISSGAHVGSSSLREFITTHPSVKLVICGHIHEAMGTDRIGDTPIINHGMAAEGHFTDVDAKPGEGGEWEISFKTY
jgi:Icc-related predicted phosphoesterase